MSGPVLVGGSSALAAALASAAGAGPHGEAALCIAGAFVALAAVFAARQRKRRARWKEIDRLSRAMFAAAGVRRRSRLR